MKSIVYVHYQKSERDGSYVHTRMFTKEMGLLCDAKNIDFTVIEPALIDEDGVSEVTQIQKIKTFFARFYLSDLKALVKQIRQMLVERKKLKAVNADMVVTRYNWNTLSIIWAARSIGIPVVLELNSPDEEDRGIKFYRLPGMTYFFSTERAIHLSDGAFAVSEALAKDFRENFNGSSRLIHGIHNGVSLDKFNPQLDASELRADFGIAKDAVVIGFVGSFAPWHGLDLLFEAFAKLVGDGAPVHLLMVGQPRKDSGEWLDRAAMPDIAGNITFAGHVGSGDVNRYIAAMDITVLANSAWYCSPLKIFEYMAMGKATVAVATDPVQEVIVDRRDGLLFEQGSSSALYKSLKELVSDSDMRLKLGNAGRQRVASEFSWQDNASRVFDLLEVIERTRLTGQENSNG